MHMEVDFLDNWDPEITKINQFQNKNTLDTGVTKIMLWKIVSFL